MKMSTLYIKIEDTAIRNKNGNICPGRKNKRVEQFLSGPS